jgi:hypothetical protein
MSYIKISPASPDDSLRDFQIRALAWQVETRKFMQRVRKIEAERLFDSDLVRNAKETFDDLDMEMNALRVAIMRLPDGDNSLSAWLEVYQILCAFMSEIDQSLDVLASRGSEPPDTPHSGNA